MTTETVMSARLHLNRFEPPGPTDVLAIHGLTGHGRRWRLMFNRFLPDVAVLAPI